ncbi:MAG: GNAT family N-acetyltransferase [Oscillospiraceae bacterium]|jgi:GNAT superfamily N-acetyltransferase|nr:GNAT family N-acetyltransferase [Oscillospiraceae bacterium]
MTAESARRAENFELEDIIRLWSICFGDSPELVRQLYAACSLLETTFVAGSPPDAMMTAFDGLSLSGRRASYIYALCTRPEKRGRGLAGAVLSRIIDESFARGTQLVCLHPASLSLWRWYRDAKGFKPLILAQPREIEPLPAADGTVREISAEEFIILSGEFPDLNYPLPLLRAQDLFWRDGSGAFLALESGGVRALALAKARGDALLLKQLCAPPNAERALATLAARHFGLPRVSLLAPVTPSRDALPDLCYVTNDPDFIPDHNFVFPFLLD